MGGVFYLHLLGYVIVTAWMTCVRWKRLNLPLKGAGVKNITWRSWQPFAVCLQCIQLYWNEAREVSWPCWLRQVILSHLWLRWPCLYNSYTSHISTMSKASPRSQGESILSLALNPHWTDMLNKPTYWFMVCFNIIHAWNSPSIGIHFQIDEYM